MCKWILFSLFVSHNIAEIFRLRKDNNIFSCDSSSIQGNVGLSVGVNEFPRVLNALIVHVIILTIEK